MAQDYAGGLQRSPRPNRIPRDGAPNADMVERERGARELDALEGRFGRFVDSGGNWATAWRAPPLGQSIGPTPVFVSPGRVVKFKTGETALQSAPSDDPEQPTESVLIAPGQWVVRYDGDEEAAIVVEDATFRGEMTSEADRAALDAQKNSVQGAGVGFEAPVQPSEAAEPQNAPTVTPEASAGVTHLMVDHFIKLVMSDNNRLRFELNDAQVMIGHLKAGNARNYEERQKLEVERDQWKREHDELARQRAVPAEPPPAYNPPDPDPVDVPPELSPDPVEAALAEAPPRVAGSKRKG